MIDEKKYPAIIATWRRNLDLAMDFPSDIRWSDGRTATLQDYFNHALDTHTFERRGSGVELRIYPDLIADVRYDPRVGRWFLTGEDIPTIPLELTDPNAPDDQIIAEVYTYPIVYRTRIHR